MKLMLTSSGLETPRLRKLFSSLLETKVPEARIIVIHTASKPEHLVYVDKVGRELSKCGILLPNITYVDINSRNSSPSLSDYDAIYVCGGNTYHILDRIRKVSLDKSIPNFVKTRGIYVGVSAGSIIACKSIEIAGWGSEGDPNDIHLKDLGGLGFTNIAVFPHYQSKLKKEVDEFRQKSKNPVESLRDKEAIVIKGNKITKISRT